MEAHKSSLKLLAVHIGLFPGIILQIRICRWPRVKLFQRAQWQGSWVELRIPEDLTRHLPRSRCTQWTQLSETSSPAWILSKNEIGCVEYRFEAGRRPVRRQVHKGDSGVEA